MTDKDRLPVLSQMGTTDGIRATLPDRETGPELPVFWSGRRDLNPRPLDPSSPVAQRHAHTHSPRSP